MEEVVNQVDLKIDKSNWKLVKFGDLVFEPKEVCKDIFEEKIEHVVGLEHIDSGDIHLKKSTGIEESTTFTKKFREGDVLFGRRRAYLKKAAQAEFDGICSGDITVFRAKKDLSPDLLPFIVHNEKFFDYAIKHSAGGLSPRVKFKDLANYEFLLPPKTEQARLTELLWAMDEVIEREKEVLENILKCHNSFYKNIFNGKYYKLESVKNTKLGLVPKDWKIARLDDLVSAPICYGIVQPGENIVGGIPIVQIKNLIGFNMKMMHYVAPKIERGYTRSRISKGDLLLAIKGTIGICNTVPDGFEGNIGRDTAKINIPDPNVRDFLLHLFQGTTYQLLFNKLKVGSTRHELSIATLRNLPILIPPETIMKKIVEIFYHLNKSKTDVLTRIASSNVVQKSLINKIF